MTEKLFAIGDIHGCFQNLKSLMDKIPFQQDCDTIVFLGDYIDRGPDSFNVVSYLIDLKSKCQNAVFLKGNHEDMLDGFISGTNRQLFLVNGGEQTLRSYLKRQYLPSPSPIPAEHLEFFGSLLPYYETEHFIFVHAGLKEGLDLQDQNPHDLFWIRKQFINSDYDFGKKVVFGHTPFPEPYISHNKIGIDTGAVYGNKLTCVELTEMVFFFA
ncbi:MAG: serine/threonine protein phosphatase [Desulfobacterales bacterium]|jgi:serine/threonine protein phosphatase 1|nr:serine/threonine protein phosphatase [Desulfobacterales bacterium]